MNRFYCGALVLVASAALPIAAQAAGPVDWSGAYLGVSAGYGRDVFDISNIEFEGSPSGIPPFSFNGYGPLGGVTIGGNLQWAGTVAGIEADFSLAHITGVFPAPAYKFTVYGTQNSLATLRGRLGFAAGSVLFYGTAGLAVAGISAELDDIHSSTHYYSNDSHYFIGWTAGFGIEIAAGDRVSFKSEVLYFDLGTQSFAFFEGSGGVNPITADVHASGFIGRAGINFHL